MYQGKILNTILAGDSSAFASVGTHDELIFTDEGTHALYQTLQSYFIKYNKVPSTKYLEDFFVLEKGSKSQKAYEALDSLEGTTEDLEALIKLQLGLTVKRKTVSELNDFSTELQLAPASQLKEVAFKFQSTVATLTQTLEEDNHRRGAMYGEAAADSYERRYKERRDSDTGYYIGKTGFAGIDDHIGGIHSVDFFSLMGFTNQGKSPLMRKIAYSMATQGLNVMFISLEMSYDSIEDAFYTLHAGNYKEFGLSRPKITHSKVKQASLTDQEEEYYFKEVVPHFNNDESLGTVEILQPNSNFCMDELFMEVYRVHQTKMPLDAIFVDYAIPLIKPTKKGNSFSKEDYNEAHRRLRLFGLTFDSGRGLPIFNAVQANRQGFMDAIAPKNKENLYNLAAVGEYNAIEKDSTHVISILQTEPMKAEGVVQLQHLKSRESSLFPTQKVQFDGATGQFRDSISTGVSEDEITSLLQELEL